VAVHNGAICLQPRSARLTGAWVWGLESAVRAWRRLVSSWRRLGGQFVQLVMPSLVKITPETPGGSLIEPTANLGEIAHGTQGVGMVGAEAARADGCGAFEQAAGVVQVALGG
jgi:hypothetical protein